jgi:hypothetical protein
MPGLALQESASIDIEKACHAGCGSKPHIKTNSSESSTFLRHTQQPGASHNLYYLCHKMWTQMWGSSAIFSPVKCPLFTWVMKQTVKNCKTLSSKRMQVTPEVVVCLGVQLHHYLPISSKTVTPKHRCKGHKVAQRLRHYATSWKVAGSKPDEVNFFNLPNPSSHTWPWGSLSL